MLKASPGVYNVGDLVGLSGLQARYETQLAGRRGALVQAVSAKTGERRTLFEIDAGPGKPLRTTLDIGTQKAAEDALADVDSASALVAIRPSDGHVLAAANGPGSGGYATATIGQYAPGSTFKVASSLALLRAGLSVDTFGACPKTLRVDGRSFENYDEYPSRETGNISMRAALAHSCNTWFIGQRDKVGQAELSDAAASLGLGVDHDLGLPSYLGDVPTKAGATEHAASLIGQGKVLASPLAMATVAASVQARHTVVPQLLPANRSEPTESSLSAAEAKQLQAMMRSTVASGSGLFLSDLPGPPVIAKTGTAEFGTKTPPQTHAWMIAAQGDLAVAVFVEVGDSGSHTAGPVLEEFLRAVS